MIGTRSRLSPHHRLLLTPSSSPLAAYHSEDAPLSPAALHVTHSALSFVVVALLLLPYHPEDTLASHVSSLPTTRWNDRLSASFRPRTASSSSLRSAIRCRSTTKNPAGHTAPRAWRHVTTSETPSLRPRKAPTAALSSR